MTRARAQVLEADFKQLDASGDGSVTLEELLQGANWQGAGKSRVWPKQITTMMIMIIIIIIIRIIIIIITLEELLQGANWHGAGRRRPRRPPRPNP